MVRTIFDNKQLEFIENNYKEITYEEMSKLELFESLNGTQIKNKARAMGLSKRRKFNDGFFEKINTKEKAYWLGFIYADGYIVYNEDIGNYELGIELHEKDAYILNSLNKLFGNKHIIKFREREISFNRYEYISKIASLRIYSKKVCDDLIANGIVTNKTKSLTYPIVDNDVFFHFLRGFFDGDGCLYNNINGHKFIHFTNSNDIFLKYISNVLLKYDINSKVYKEKDKKFRLVLNKYHSEKLLNYLYKDSDELKLVRKYHKYKS